MPLNRYINILLSSFWIIILFYLIPPVFALERYTSSPLININSSSWESKEVSFPVVLYEKGLYKMWYGGNDGSYWSIGYAISLDGINWIKYPNNPVIRWNNLPEEPKDYKEHTIIKENGIYKMWYEAARSPSTISTIGYSISNNGINWTHVNYKVLSPSQNWDSLGLVHPFVLKDSDEYKMWYFGTNPNEKWKGGFATSNDGINWTPYPNNPILFKTKTYEYDQFDGTSVIKENDIYKMWYHTNVFNVPWQTNICYATSSSGINWVKDESGPVLSAGAAGTLDSISLSAGFSLQQPNTLFYWYGAKSKIDNISASRIGLAYEGSKPTPLPTMTGFPTPTPSLAPTPTPTPIEPIVIIPGIMSSWNGPAILHNESVSPQSWKIPSFVKDYDGLLQTFGKLHYTENDTVFLWPYDWRKSITSITSDFDSFLSSKVFSKYPDRKIHIVAHSLGGLVGRNWVQSGANKDRVHQFLSVAAPNQGTIQPYSLWEAGEIPTDSFLISLAGKIFVELNRKIYETPKQTIQSLFPILKDLLPIEPYLKKNSNNTLIPISSMVEKNTWLPTINAGVSQIFPILTALYGTGYSSPTIYRVTSPDWFEEKLGLWKDGKPIKTPEESDGDAMIPTSRAALSPDKAISVNQTHANLVASDPGIRSILSALSIPFTDGDIIPGKATEVRPSLLFLLRSPATMKVTRNSETYSSEDGIIFISGASSGTYTVTVTGEGNSTYGLVIGQFGTSSESWNEINVPITDGEKNTYSFDFQTKTPTIDPFMSRPISDIYTDLEQQVRALTPLVSQKSFVTKTLLDIQQLKKAYGKKQNFQMKICLDILLTDLSIMRRVKPSIKLLNETLAIDETLIDLSARLFDEKKYPIFRPMVKILEITTANVLKNQENEVKKRKLTEERKRYISLLYLEAKKEYEDSKKQTSGIRSFFTLSHAFLLLTEMH